MAKAKKSHSVPTDRERKAQAAMGGWIGPGLIPQPATTDVLKAHGINGSTADAIAAACVSCVGDYHLFDNLQRARLTRAEVEQQARDTADLSGKLLTRIRYMDPWLRSEVEMDALLATREGEQPWHIDAGRHYLEYLQALMAKAAARLSGMRSKTPPRTRPRDKLLRDVVAVVGQHVPNLTDANCRKVACDLLQAWAVRVPDDDRTVRRAARGKGRGNRGGANAPRK